MDGQTITNVWDGTGYVAWGLSSGEGVMGEKSQVKTDKRVWMVGGRFRRVLLMGKPSVMAEETGEYG